MSKIRRDDKCHVREIRESNKTFTSPLNLALPGPLYNQPSHEMKCESMLIIVYIRSKRLKKNLEVLKYGCVRLSKCGKNSKDEERESFII